VCRLASVVWTLRAGICVDYGSGLCWGDGYVRLSLDRGCAGVYGCWGFKRLSKILLAKIVESSFRWLFLAYSV